MRTRRSKRCTGERIIDSDEYIDIWLEVKKRHKMMACAIPRSSLGDLRQYMNGVVDSVPDSRHTSMRQTFDVLMGRHSSGRDMRLDAVCVMWSWPDGNEGQTEMKIST